MIQDALAKAIQRPVAELLPHRPPMVLLDRAVAADEEAFSAEVDIRPGLPFHALGGVPAWVGIEYMAQAVAAFAGAESLAKGEKVKTGFLLGTREYTASRPLFRDGETLTVTAKKVIYQPNALSVMDCEIRSGGEAVAKAMLNVYQVADLDAYLRENTP